MNYFIVIIVTITLFQVNIIESGPVLHYDKNYDSEQQYDYDNSVSNQNYGKGSYLRHHKIDTGYDGEQQDDYYNNDDDGAGQGKFHHHNKKDDGGYNNAGIGGILNGILGGYGGIGGAGIGGGGIGGGGGGIGGGIGGGGIGGGGIGSSGIGGGLFDSYGYQPYSLTNILGGLVNELLGTVPRFATDLFGGKNYDQKFVADGFFGPGYNKKGGGIVGGLVNSLLTATFDL